MHTSATICQPCSDLCLTLPALFIGCHFFLIHVYLCIADCVSASCFQILSADSTSSIGLNVYFSSALHSFRVVVEPSCASDVTRP